MWNYFIGPIFRIEILRYCLWYSWVRVNWFTSTIIVYLHEIAAVNKLNVNGVRLQVTNTAIRCQVARGLFWRLSDVRWLGVCSGVLSLLSRAPSLCSVVLYVTHEHKLEPGASKLLRYLQSGLRGFTLHRLFFAAFFVGLQCSVWFSG